MIVSIHQPHLFPWLGYLDRMRRCDLFVVLDHVQFERQNYQNRVRIKTRQGPRWLVAPVEQHSRSERIIDKRLLQESGPRSWSARAFRLLQDAYGGAPFFAPWAGDVREVLESGAHRLIELDLASIQLLRRAFGISTPVVRSSMLGVRGKGAELVLEICRTVRADAFLGGIGASRRYIDPAVFRGAGVNVLWHDFVHPRYVQHPRESPFAEGVTALDLLFSCGPEARCVLDPAQRPSRSQQTAADLTPTIAGPPTGVGAAQKGCVDGEGDAERSHVLTCRAMDEPTIDMYMTLAPHAIEPTRTLAEAHQMMRAHGIRHLPVVEGDALVGLVSRGDLHLFEALDGVDRAAIPVRVAMRSPVYSVSPDSRVREVAMHMAQHKYGSAVVVDGGKVVGIFTAVDGLVGLSLLLDQLRQASR